MTGSEPRISKIAEFPGLTREEVEESRRRHGSNVITPPLRPPWWRLYLEKFRDPIIRLLCLAALAALVVGWRDGHFIEGVGIIAAILVSTWLSFINEHRAARDFELLNRASDGDGVQVIREGRHQTAPRRDLVVGDVFLAEQGAEIPADAEVLAAVSLSINEASLTGESLPAAKRPARPGGEEEPGHAYPPHAALRGSVVADGHGIFRVTAVGDATESGQAARSAAEPDASATPLFRQLNRLANSIGTGAFAAAGLVFAAQTVIGARNGEIHGIGEKGGKLIPIPLEPGQWFCFAALGLIILILSSRAWGPTLRNSLDSLGRARFLRDWLEWMEELSLGRLLTASAGVAVGSILLGLILGLIKISQGDWLPLPALGAFLRYLMVAVTVIVMAVPEGLPMCVTLALAYSMRKMAAANNLVRKMHACETIGAASVICSDKTGTLTRNEMRVAEASFPFLDGKTLPAGNALADRLAEAVAANSTANLEREGERAAPLGNPTEAALLLWLDDSGRDYADFRRRFEIRQRLTFSTERKFMASAGLSGLDSRPRLYLKGAPEIVLSRCLSYRDASGAEKPLDETIRAGILSEAAARQARGMRTLGLAEREVEEKFLDAPLDPEVSGLAWCGFFAIADPIRLDVPAAIASALAAGVKVKLVTGDSQATAREIARQSGLWREGDGEEECVSGDEFMALADPEAAEAASRVKVMSRARPLHKLRLVELLRRAGEVVAVTGDGTNDAPALNRADVGLAMGMTGTSAAKEAADIILLDDSFASIVSAVAWGRSLYANIQKFVTFQLTVNVAAVGIALLGPFTGVTLPLTAAQILWVNLIMDAFAALALASEPPDWGLMRNPPRPAQAGIVTAAMRRTIFRTGAVFMGLFLLVASFGKHFPLEAGTAEGRHNLTLFFTGFVALQFWNMFNSRVFGSDRSALSGLWASKVFLIMLGVIAIGQALLVQFGGAMFRVTPLSLREWVTVAMLTSSVLWVGEISRLIRRSRSSQDYWVYSN
ncbi:MAG: calcium-translocating P-type ATPase, PMCA-type [Planctomycetota bacterium]|nr:calcium-translocating P-type ATPase, PMCA-type [Planctomycetota bacterium]